MPDQDFTLSLKMTADGASAVQESAHLADNLERALAAARELSRVSPTPGNATHSPSSAASPSPAARPPSAGGLSARASKASVLGGIGGFFGAIGKGIAAVFGVFKSVVSGVWTVLKGVASFVAAPFKLAWKGVKTVLKAVAGVLAAVVGAGYGAVKLLSPAGDAELSETRFSLQLGSRAKGRRRFAELRDYSRSSGYSMQDVGATHNALHVAGMYSRRHLEALGNAANAFGKSLPELANAVMMLKNGGGSMGLRSLRQYGVTNDMLKQYGVRFKKGGELKSSGKEVAEAVMRYFEDRFRHSTAIVGGTWKATLQQASVEVTDAFAMGFRGALKPATAYVRDHLIPAITEIGKYFASLDWNKILATPLKILSGITDAFRQLASLDMHNLGVENLKAIGSALWEVGKELVKYFANVAIGIITDFFNHFGGVGEVLHKAFESLGILLKASLDVLGIVLESASDGFILRVKKLIYGKDAVEGKARGEFTGMVSGVLAAAAGYHPNQYNKYVPDPRSNQQLRDDARSELLRMGFSDEAISKGIENLKQGQYVSGAMGAGAIAPWDVSIAYKALREANVNLFEGLEDSYVYQQQYSPEASRARTNLLWNDAQQQMGELHGTWSTGKDWTWDETGKATRNTEGLSSAIQELGSVAAVSSYQLKMFDSGIYGREAVKMHNFLRGLGYSNEEAIKGADAWMKLLMDTSEEAMRDAAEKRHEQFKIDHSDGSPDPEWKDFNSRRNRKYRESIRHQLRNEFLDYWQQNAPNNKQSSDQSSYRQEIQGAQTVAALQNLPAEIANLRRFLTPIVRAYEQSMQTA